MKKSSNSDGSILFTLPDSASDIEEIGMRPKRRKRRGAAVTPEEPAELTQILEALTEDEPVAPEERETLVTGFSVDVGEGKKVRRRRGAKTPKPESLDIDIALKPDEDAVVLIEQDGAYEWHFPQKVDQKKRRRRRGGPPIIESKSAHFSIPIGEGEPPRKRRGATRVFGGRFTNFIKGKVKGFVMKFVVRKAVGALSRRLEKGVEAGPVIINSAKDPERWSHQKDYSGVELPTDRPARILLMIHGTFSSTEGSFGGLTAHKAGQAFLASAMQHYDAVLAYDHYTLADTPEQNAEEIFDQLDALQSRSKGGLEIDAISFSRGGLVYRFLTEQIAPHEQSLLSFRKAIFVGCTNAGTELANHENWKTLVDFYTNMVAAASRLLKLYPSSRIAGVVLNQGIRVIGSLVKYMAQDAVANNAVPGLASMRPEGPFVKAINEMPVNRTRPGARNYFAIGSDFEPGSETFAEQFGKRMAAKLADGVIDRLMGEENDLVVHTDSMWAVDPVGSLGARLHFHRNAVIFHTVYFQQPQIADQCAEWLDLLPQRSKLSREAPRDWWSSEVTTDFITMPTTIPVGDATRTLKGNNSRFVDLERDMGSFRLHYGLQRGELESALDGIHDNDTPLIDALGMHETDANAVTMDEALDTDDIGGFRDRTASIPSGLPGGFTHAVILGDAGPVGIAAPPEIFLPEEMEEMAAPADDWGEEAASPPRSRGADRVSKNKASRRRRGGGSSGPETPRMEENAAPPAPETVWCYAHATMPEEAVLNRKTTVEVTLSRDEIMLAAGASATGGGKVRTDKNLIVQVQARKNCIVSGESREELPVPAPGEDPMLFFDIIPKHEGLGEVRVIVRQGNRPIANLKLFPRFVASAGGQVTRMAEASADLVPIDNRREIKNVLFIREAQMGDARALDFDFEFEVDRQQVRARGRSKPFATEGIRIDYITSLYKDIEDFWADSDSEYDAFMFRLRARGAEIFQQLIPKELQKVLWDNRSKLKAIQVFSDEPFIPWELAYLVEPGSSITLDSHFLAEKGMVRGYSNPDGVTVMAPNKLKLRKDKAKFVIPGYPRGSGQELPGAQDEKAMLKKVLDAKPLKPNKIDVITSMMKPGNADILHFACHGVANPDSIWDAGLLMQGKMQGGQYKEDKLMSSEVEGYANLRDEESPGPVVVLNACQIGRTGYNLTGTGGFARAFMKKGAGAFIGTHWSIGDLSALEFSKTLYEQLLDGKNMMTAVNAARKAAKNNEEVTWLAYVVYADPYAKLEIEE